MFMLIMQFFWKYIDDLMGKGISATVILELLFYVSASLIPLALPLAMLLSSIMTIGNLAENNELTALKSAGMSLYKILKPLTVFVFFICIATFYFANYVIPVANLKWRSLIYDIQETKISTILTPGKYNDQLDGFTIKIDQGTDSYFTGVTIHDHTNKNIVKTIKAESGEVFKSQDGSSLFFNLKNGMAFEEMSSFPEDGTNSSAFHPSRRYTFADATYKIDISGFKMNKTDEDLFKNKHEMFNVFQLNQAVDSIQKQTFQVLLNFNQSLKTNHPYFLLQGMNTNVNPKNGIDSFSKSNSKIITLSDIPKPDLIVSQNTAISKIRTLKENLESQKVFMETIGNELNRYLIEFNRKFSLTMTIMVLFFVGAPLGAIVKKGGFGAPVVIAALLFMIYFVLISVGESLATQGVLSPFWGMWMATFILTPFAILLMRSAANDSKFFNSEFWKSIFKRKKQIQKIK